MGSVPRLRPAIMFIIIPAYRCTSHWLGTPSTPRHQLLYRFLYDAFRHRKARGKLKMLKKLRDPSRSLKPRPLLGRPYVKPRPSWTQGLRDFIYQKYINTRFLIQSKDGPFGVRFRIPPLHFLLGCRKQRLTK